MPSSILPPLWAHGAKSNLKWTDCFRFFRTPVSYFRSNWRSWPGSCLGNLERLKNFTFLKCFCVQMSQIHVGCKSSSVLFFWDTFNYLSPNKVVKIWSSQCSSLNSQQNKFRNLPGKLYLIGLVFSPLSFFIFINKESLPLSVFISFAHMVQAWRKSA